MILNKKIDLDEIISNIEIKRVNFYDKSKLMEKIENHFIKGKEYIEFEKDISSNIFYDFFFSKWKESNRNPMIFNKITILEDCLNLNFHSPSSSGGNKYIYPESEIAFFKNGLYYGIGIEDKKGNLNLYHQNIYFLK